MVEEVSVRRYVTAFFKEGDTLAFEIDLAAFSLEDFQREFKVDNPEDPMFDCFEIKPENTEFLKLYLERELEWNFEVFSYFLEAESLE